MRNMLAALAGALFGTGLYLSGMTDTRKVQGFLDFFGDWDPTLAFVMGGAILPMAVAWALTRGRRPVVGGDFPERPDPRLDRKLIVGAVLFQPRSPQHQCTTDWLMRPFCTPRLGLAAWGA